MGGIQSEAALIADLPFSQFNNNYDNFSTKGSVLNLELIITVSVSGANYVVRMLLIYAAGLGLVFTEINYLDFGGK